MMEVTKGKNYKTQSGLNVTIYRIYDNDVMSYPVHGAIEIKKDVWRSLSWTKEGFFIDNPHWKLVEVKSPEDLYKEAALNCDIKVGDYVKVGDVEANPVKYVRTNGISDEIYNGWQTPSSKINILNHLSSSSQHELRVRSFNNEIGNFTIQVTMSSSSKNVKYTKYIDNVPFFALKKIKEYTMEELRELVGEKFIIKES